jgi:hypothetical protein
MFNLQWQHFSAKTPTIVTLAILALASTSDAKTNTIRLDGMLLKEASATLAIFSAETSQTATVAMFVLASLSGRRTKRKRSHLLPCLIYIGKIFCFNLRNSDCCYSLLAFLERQ